MSPSNYQAELHELTQAHVHFKPYQGGTLYFLVHFAPQKRHSALDRIISCFERRLQARLGSDDSEVPLFQKISDCYSGKVKTYTGSDYTSDEHYLAIFDITRRGKFERHAFNTDVLNFKRKTQAGAGYDPIRSENTRPECPSKRERDDSGDSSEDKRARTALEIELKQALDRNKTLEIRLAEAQKELALFHTSQFDEINMQKAQAWDKYEDFLTTHLLGDAVGFDQKYATDHFIRSIGITNSNKLERLKKLAQVVGLTDRANEDYKSLRKRVLLTVHPDKQCSPTQALLFSRACAVLNDMPR